MSLAIDLAKKWYWKTWTNPLVWAILVKDWKIIWKWYHKKFWWAHAEVEAINSVKKKSDIKWSTMYVTLEPCMHYWKTAPCADLVLKSWISELIIWSLDPNTIASWSAEMFKSKWIKVSLWVLKKQCENINGEFFNMHLHNKCYVIAKIASSLDWCVALSNWESKWITNKEARENWRRLRWEVDAILVGINTVLKDDPLLTTRIKWKKNPIRVVLDSKLRINKDANILNQDAKTIIFQWNWKLNENWKLIHWELIENWKLKTENWPWIHETIKLKWDRVSPKEVLKLLYDKWVRKVLIEWWASIITSFLKQWLIDKLVHYQSPIILWWDGKKMIWDLAFLSIDKSYKLELVKTKKIWDNLRRDYLVNQID